MSCPVKDRVAWLETGFYYCNLPDLQRWTHVTDEGGDSINCSIAP